MTQNKKIAITGGIGSGKSAAANILKEFGYPVFSCDEIYSELCAEPNFLAQIENAFPGALRQGELDRAALSRLVFQNQTAREKLNRLTHPLILKRLFEKMQGHSLSFAEVPLLFESGSEKYFDGVIVVMRDFHARLQAVMARNALSEAQARARMSAQFDYANPPPGAFLLYNDGSIHDLQEKIVNYLKNMV